MKAETVNTVSLLVTVCDIVVTSCISFVSVQARKLIHSAAPPLPKKSFDFSGTPKILFSPVCLNVIFLSLPRILTAALFRSLCSHKRSWQNYIPSSRSFSFNQLSGNKKAGTQMRTDFPQKDRPIPCGGGFTFM